MNYEGIGKYYDRCHKDYKRIWHLDRCMAMHSGFWDHSTKKLPDALTNQNKILAEQAAITAADHVLDAGSGGAPYILPNIMDAMLSESRSAFCG